MRRALPLLVVVLIAATTGAFLVGHDQFRGHSATTVASGSKPALLVAKIKESFTLLACSRATTLGMEGCAEHQILILDRRVDASRRHVLRHLRTRAAKLRFVRAERDWLNYRRSTCLSRADAYEGGSFAPVSFADCLVVLDRQHVGEFATLRASYTGG